MVASLSSAWFDWSRVRLSVGSFVRSLVGLFTWWVVHSGRALSKLGPLVVMVVRLLRCAG